MKVTIINKASYPREIQYYRQYKFEVLQPRKGVTLDCQDAIELVYWQSLSHKGFEVVVETSNAPDQSTQEQKECMREEEVKEEQIDPYSKYSDEDLKRIINNLGISTRYSKRWRLIDLIKESIPEGTDLDQYL